jgi:hypothetical protein
MELLTVMVVVRDRHTEGGMMITNHDHHTTVTKHRFPPRGVRPDVVLGQTWC